MTNLQLLTKRVKCKALKSPRTKNLQLQYSLRCPSAEATGSILTKVIANPMSYMIQVPHVKELRNWITLPVMICLYLWRIFLNLEQMA